MWKRFKNWKLKSAENSFTAAKVIINGHLYTLRQSNVQDINHFLQIEREIYDGKTPWDYNAFMREINRKQGSLYLTLANSTQVIGFIGLNWNGMESHITNFAVAVPFQHQQIGRWLLDYAIRYSHDLAVSKITLEVSVENQIAIHLYHQLGFKDGRVKKFYYSFNNGDAMNMYLNLE